MNLKIVISAGLLLVPIGCRKNSVGQILGLELGVPLSTKTVVETPAGPPLFARAHNKYYVIDHPNFEFKKVGVAVTKNNETDRQRGLFFEKENIIWGAVFMNGACDEARYNRTSDFLKKNWHVTKIHEKRQIPSEKDKQLWINGIFTSKSVLWEIICTETTTALVVTDNLVILNALDRRSKGKYLELMKEFEEMLKRKM